MSRPMNVPKRMETLLDKALMHHEVVMRSFARHIARPDTASGKVELARVQKHEEKLADTILALKRLVEKV